MLKINSELQFAVIGLGRFGLSIVQTLADYDINILACDKNVTRLHDATEFATHVVQADAADQDAMERLGLGNFDVVVFAMGRDFEASIMATMYAKELGAKKVVVRAFDLRQKKILERVGADKVVLPESEMGVKVAHQLVSPNVLDLLEHSDHYTVSEMHPMEEWVGKSLGELDIRKQFGYVVLAIIQGDQTILPEADQVLRAEDVLVVISPK